MMVRSEAVLVKPVSNPWIVCETSGRWAAALRLAIAREGAAHRCTGLPRRIQEVRSLAEFDLAMSESHAALGLVEARLDNLAAVLELLSRGWKRNARLAALLDESLRRQLVRVNSQRLSHRDATDALCEAGALAVIETPRHISRLFAAAERLLAFRTRVLESEGDPTSIADRAWAALPWQDA
jgi:hypothetical protein